MSGVIRRNCRQKVHFSGIRWIRPQSRYKKDPKNVQNLTKLKFIAQ